MYYFTSIIHADYNLNFHLEFVMSAVFLQNFFKRYISMANEPQNLNGPICFSLLKCLNFFTEVISF